MRMESLLPLLTRSINFISDGGREAECILLEADRQRAAPQPHLQAEMAGSDQRLERPPPSPATAAAMRSAESSRPSRPVPASPSRSHPGARIWVEWLLTAISGVARRALRTRLPCKSVVRRRVEPLTSAVQRRGSRPLDVRLRSQEDAHVARERAGADPVVCRKRSAS